ncbi:hypothetical protein M6B38_312320 [Iris pallida]|uniref:Uncharacterized protein n=1 Tax=Iris pallida TaxID=29817 RepID=A0AAX6HH64_IRIPA|nr:hypothetical protein M6B38_312320 [Iris pallida]
MRHERRAATLTIRSSPSAIIFSGGFFVLSTVEGSTSSSTVSSNGDAKVPLPIDPNHGPVRV